MYTIALQRIMNNLLQPVAVGQTGGPFSDFNAAVRLSDIDFYT